jgi:protein-disulfide isomerase
MRLTKAFIAGLATMLLVGCGSAVYTIDTVNAPVLGDPGAPHVLVVYSDFECPFCKRTAFRLKRFIADHPDRVRLYFKHYPLRQHRFAMKAAIAAEAARRQNKFWQMHDLIFANADNLDEGTFERLASEIRLDIEQFRKDMESPAVKRQVTADRDEGEALGLWGTPFFVLDGKPYDGSVETLIERLKRE